MAQMFFLLAVRVSYSLANDNPFLHHILITKNDYQIVWITNCVEHQNFTKDLAAEWQEDCHSSLVTSNKACSLPALMYCKVLVNNLE